MKQNIETLIHEGKPLLCVITAFEDIYSLACSMAQHYHVPTRVILTPVDQEVQTAREVLAQGIEALVGRGQLVTLLRKETTLPVIAIEVSTADTLRSLLPFQGKGIKVGVLGFTGFVTGVEEIAALINVPIHRMDIESLEDVPAVLEQARSLGIRDLMGSYGLMCKAQQAGFNGVILRSGREAVARAFAEATHIISLRMRWREQSELARSVFNATQDAVIYMDSKGLVSCMNANAGEFFGMNPETDIGRPLRDFLPGIEPGMILNNASKGLPVAQMTVQTRNRTVIVRHSPLYHHEVITGAVLCVQDVTELQRLEQITRQKLHSRQLLAEYRLENIIGESEVMRRIKTMARKYAKVDASVLILGETGTGKELFAQGIHMASARAKGPFVAVNCAALPEQLLESELFGYEEGAFTGARRGGKQGLFELAHGGSILLDEIGEMSLQLQARMLRVLQDRLVMRIGGNRVIPVDVRIIAATNRSLDQLIQQGQFREDLFYRLNTLQLSVPPLRQRVEDIPLLVQYFMTRYSNLNPVVRGISNATCACLESYAWPGNVRQLRHVIERAVIMCESSIIDCGPQSFHFMDQSSRTDGVEKTEPAPVRQPQPRPEAAGSEKETVMPWKDAQQALIARTLETHHYHKGKTAETLGISRATLWRKMRAMGL